MFRTLRAREFAFKWLRVVFALLELKTRHLAWDLADQQALIYSFQDQHALEGDEVWSD
jgi:hypothetical protein